jgi:hypothetical protein
VDSWRVDGLFSNANFLPLCRLEAWRIDGGSTDTNFLLLRVVWLEAGAVNGVVVGTNFFAVGWLETRSVLTLSYVDLGIVLATGFRNFDVNSSVVVSAVVWEFDVDVG